MSLGSKVSQRERELVERKDVKQHTSEKKSERNVEGR